MTSTPFAVPAARLRVLQPAATPKTLSDAEYCARICYFALALLTAGSIYLLATRAEFLSLTNAMLALAIVWCGFLPALSYLLTYSGSSGALPFLPLFGASFALYYGLTTFSEGRIPGQLSANIVTSEALGTALGGLILLYAGFAITKYFAKGLIRPLNLPDNYNDAWFRTLVWALLMGHLAFLYAPSLHGFSSLTPFAEGAGYAAFGLLYLLWKQKRLPPLQIFLFLFVCLPAELLWRFTSGALAQIVVFGLFFQIIVWNERRRIPWVLIICTILFFIPLQPVKSEYRRYTYEHGRYAHLNPIAKATLFAELAVRYYADGAHKPERNVHDAAASRLADIRILSLVVARTPEPIGYWNGATYKLLFTNLIPRVLWRDKPMEVLGNDFGHRYGFLDETDWRTSINLPWLVEMYANFGLLGILIGMPLVGGLFALLTEKLGRPRMNFLEFVVGTTVLFRLSVDQESNFSLVASSILFILLFLTGFFRAGSWLDGSARRRAWVYEA